MSTDQVQDPHGRRPSSAGARVVTIEPSVSVDYVEFRSTQRSSAVQFASLTISRPTHNARLAVGYRRCTEFDSADAAGQDFVVVRANAEHVVAVLADGVSQSFFGDLAAAHLAEALIEELWLARVALPDSAAIEIMLHSASRTLDAQVSTRPISAHLPSLQKAALERTRTSGSQAVFTVAAMTLQTGALRLFQVGDVAAIVRRGHSIEAYMAKPEGRWSSTGRSEHHLKLADVANVDAVLLRSDGVPGGWGDSLQDSTLYSVDRFAALAADEAGKDDMSFFALTLQPTRTALMKVPAPRLAAKTSDGRSAEPQSPSPAAPAFVPPWLPPWIALATRRSTLLSVLAVGVLAGLLWWVTHSPTDITAHCEVLNAQGAEALLTIVIRAGPITSLAISRNGAKEQSIALEQAAASRWRIIDQHLKLDGGSESIRVRLLSSAHEVTRTSVEVKPGSACSIVLFIPWSSR